MIRLVVGEGKVSVVGFLVTADAAVAADLGGFADGVKAGEEPIAGFSRESINLLHGGNCFEIAFVIMKTLFHDDASIGESLHVGQRDAVGIEANVIAVDGVAFDEAGEPRRAVPRFEALNRFPKGGGSLGIGQR